MTKITLTTAEKARCMRFAAKRGFNPYDSHSAYATLAARRLRDKARRARD